MSGRLKIAITRERREDEPRVAATPETVSKLLRNAGAAEVCIERGAGASAGISDSEYESAGAKVLDGPAAVLDGAAVQLAVRAPPEEAIPRLPREAVLVGMLDPYRLNGLLETYASAGLTAFSLELLPRVTRAQAMDVLSSQSNLAGYKAVIDAAAEFERAMPMMMTAAGTIPPARVLVMGAGVAGLQAIATARRLGAIVSATDVRPAAREQVESLGAAFIGIDAPEGARAETEGGYAREMSDDYRRRQSELFASELKRQDIVIGTALVPGRPAPRLIDAAMVATMRKGSVIVDLAAEHGGNCELSPPRRTGGRTRGDHPRPPQRAGTPRGERERTLRPQPARLRDPAPRREGARFRLGRRNPRRNRPHPRRPGGASALPIRASGGPVPGSRARGRLMAEPAAAATATAVAAGAAGFAAPEIDPFVFRLAIFVLAIFVGYYVVWSVTPALHTPLMSVTNAVSSVIVVGALLAVGIEAASGAGLAAKALGFAALVLASVNIFGGFLVTQRMLAMYRRQDRTDARR